MKHLASTAVVLGTLATGAFAQSFTSPAGLSSTEGNAFFFASTNRRYMGIDATNTSQVATIKSFALRRDKGSSSTAGASTVDLTLTIGETNMAAVYSEMDRNFLPGKRTVVFPKTNVNWPDWGGASTTPAPFDFKVSLTTTYLYVGLSSGNALVWDLKLENGTNTGNYFDRDFTFYTTGTSTVLGSGCSGYSLSTNFQSNGPAMPKFGMRLRAGVTNAPASSPVTLSVGLADANATIPGFCTTLHAVPVAMLPMGVADTSGRVYDAYFNTPYDMALNGFNLYTQAFSISGASLALSNGRKDVMPTVTTTLGHDACYLWSSLTTTPNNSTVFTGGSILAEFGY
ncbi:MAG: hypothetical protein KDC87_17230 [Planctomycetes bacterium]|nr:hypothetical protein [Planctomycetota bacterium]MCB9869611.1 hypothetical protein [Planctomycetota bacterium]